MIKPRFGRITRSGTQIVSADGTPPECPTSDAHAQESGESQSTWPGAVASSARFPPSWRKRRRLVGGRHVDEEGELPEPPSLALETERDAEAASLKVHAGAQQQKNQESGQHQNPGGGAAHGGSAHDATPASAQSSAAAPSSQAGDAPVPAAAAQLSESDAAFEQILHGYRSAASDQAQPALARALLQVRDRVLDRSLPTSFNIASWILLREHIARTTPANVTATPSKSLEQVRTQLRELVKPTSNMPEPATQTLHLLLPLLLLHADRPRNARHRQRAIAMLDIACIGMGGVRA
ncbi:type III secretion system export control protein [Xanthomonas translucens pv. translucens]|uniref:type III secretion system export control protein n=2 Tax=Xanthomonas campestris pv. translucens TaxID=343 RepID=UPI00288C1CD5|nr:type III secretion system export control protein [Xanthomonas translucens]WNJ26633.1 type III secretion system export control protein [Xanthomonas translucens pv. translucens]